jgi:hypothetical protein
MIALDLLEPVSARIPLQLYNEETDQIFFSLASG